MKKLALDELGRISAEEFKSMKKKPIVVVLDNIRSMHNVGSAFRTSDAFAIEKLVLTGITARPPHREIHKTALGAQETVTWEYVEQVREAIESLHKEGYKIAVVEQIDSSTMLNKFSWNPEEKIALIFGNEVFGVSDEILELADYAIEIPQFGTKHSFNVSVTMGMVLWEFLR